MAARRREPPNQPPNPDGNNGGPLANALNNALAEAAFDPDAKLTIREWPAIQTRLTPEVELAIVEALRASHFPSDAAKAGGVDPKTYRNWIRRGAAGEAPFAEFRRRALAAELEGKDRLLAKAKGSDDWRAAAWLLERRWKAQFAARMKIVHATIKQERELALDVIASLLDEIVERVRKGDPIKDDLFDDFATAFDARLTQAQEATEEAFEAEFVDD